MSMVGAVIWAWAHHWYPLSVQRLILELIIPVVIPYCYILLFIFCRVQWRGRGEDWRGALTEVSADAPIILLWISNFGWKTCREGWALVNVYNPSIRNNMAYNNVVYSSVAYFIWRTMIVCHNTPMKKSECFDPLFTVQPCGTHIPGGNWRIIYL